METATQTETIALQGNGTAPQVTLSCSGSPQQCNGNWLKPASILDFGNVSVGSTASITFTVTNGSESQVSVSLQTAINLSSPFSVAPSGMLPATVAAGGSATFTVNFSPGQDVLSQATLVVGGSSFPLQGAGSASTVGDLSSLVVSYTDATGVRQIAQGGSIDFGQIVSGTAATLNISVCNPQETINAVTIPVPTLSGSGFTASGLPTSPVTLQPTAVPPYCEPGPDTASFQINFTASTAGNYTGALSIGTLQFALTAQSVASPLPAMSFQVSEEPLTSQQQVNLTIQLASPSPVPAVGTLTMAFAPSVQNVSDDPAIEFLATNGRQLNVSVASGSQTATYNGQSNLTFQTGTTAGTITFTLQFADAQPVTQSFTIAPQTVQIASATATLSSPNVVITINGYDNTYSVGQLSFTFYDTKGNMITPGAIAVDASSNFQQYFFNNDPAGGAFALQATFPVYG
ncbi:MAG: choice-of-anchor D domain-containing protein, partial [Pirellulales bacterium]